jgi:hypothetical protein
MLFDKDLSPVLKDVIPPEVKMLIQGVPGGLLQRRPAAAAAARMRRATQADFEL